ncbi:MAG: hypothetical protein ACXWJT_11915, partial [Xanthobacteraceae bacterium]
FADLADGVRVKLLARTGQRQFRGPSCTVDRQGPVTISALFALGIEVTPIFGQPLSKRCGFHRDPLRLSL